MKLRTVAVLAAPTFALVFLQLIAGIWAAEFGVFCGILISLIALGLFRFFEVEFPRPWWPVALPPAMSLLGVIIIFASSTSATPLYLLFAPVLSALTSLAIYMIANRSSRRCALCNRRIGGGVAFSCPRCGLLVCEQNCWDFGHCRCRLCEQNRVPILTSDGRWWDKHFGARSQYGRCQLCMATAAEADLRMCGKCGRPQCRHCWDYANGQCSRCHWTVEDLPETLREFTTHAPVKGGDG